MSYLSQPTSNSDYGVVKVGNFIEVDNNGVVSLLQDVSPTANVLFASVDADDISVDGNNVVTSVIPTAGYGIEITNLISTGYNVTFDIANSGVVELLEGPGISLSASSGSITISSYGADLIKVYGTTINYTLTSDDEYVGVSSASNVTMTLPSTAVDGRVYIIKDEYGQGAGKITIQPPAGTLIDKKTNYVISIPNQSVQMVYRAGNWWII